MYFCSLLFSVTLSNDYTKSLLHWQVFWGSVNLSFHYEIENFVHIEQHEKDCVNYHEILSIQLAVFSKEVFSNVAVVSFVLMVLTYP